MSLESPCVMSSMCHLHVSGKSLCDVKHVSLACLKSLCDVHVTCMSLESPCVMSSMCHLHVSGKSLCDVKHVSLACL